MENLEGSKPGALRSTGELLQLVLILPLTWRKKSRQRGWECKSRMLNTEPEEVEEDTEKAI
jgi:hypothetical protein